MTFTFPLLLAQVVTNPAVTSPDALEQAPLGWLYFALWTGLVGVIGWLVAKFVAPWLRARAELSRIGVEMERIWQLASSIVADIEVRLRPTIKEVTADGKISAAEGQRLKAEALAALKAA